MIRHLTAADFRLMPWANGKGTTLELARQDRDGALLWRLSRAAVVEDGDFSVFPGVERNLTVLAGPGFDLVTASRTLRAAPFVPVAFAGEQPIRAARVLAPCDDFNVMTARSLPRPTVALIRTPGPVSCTGDLLALYLVGAATVDGMSAAAGDLVLSDCPLIHDGAAPALAVTLWLTPGRQVRSATTTAPGEASAP